MIETPRLGELRHRLRDAHRHVRRKIPYEAFHIICQDAAISHSLQSSSPDTADVVLKAECTRPMSQIL